MTGIRIVSLLAMTSVLAISTSAMAQNAPAADAAKPADSTEDADIIVTGTLIRGTAPVGANSIAIGQDQIDVTGAISSNALLASIPQVTNYFNRVPVSDLGIAVNQIQISRPNLRNISGNNAASSATLILVDGHRIASAGVSQASIDPDLLPTGAIERVEVVTEGGSATYGADAVAGVINFITRKKFDGFKVGGHYGFAKNYWQWDANATAGTTFENGSVYISYSYTKSDALFGRERDCIRNLDYSTATYQGRDLTCSNPNLAVNTVINATGGVFSSVSYAAPAFVANTANRCDNSDNRAIVPKAERHGVLAGLNWNFDDNTAIDVRAYWGQRKTRSSSILTGSINVGASNPFVAGSLPPSLVLGPGILFGFLPVTRVAAVNFSLEPFSGRNSQNSDTLIREYGANAELTHELSNGWQLRGLVNWSQSDSRFSLTTLSQARLNAAGVATTAATAFNPFNIASNNAALIADITDDMIAGQTKDNLLQLRMIAEGKLFDLPGGDARLAFGYEFTNDKLQRRFQSGIRIGTLSTFPLIPYSRNVHSVFGEVNLPLIGNGDGGSMLTVAASGRYDRYSDFGKTFNPKVGVTFEPTKGFKLRGNWGTSFTAPTPVDQLGSLGNSITPFPFVPFVRPGTTLLPGANNTIALQGSQAGLKPQKADTWSVGVDLDPTRGLHASISYYSVKFKDVLGTPTSNAGIFNDFPNNILYDVNGLSAAQITTFLGSSTQLTNALASLGGGRVVEAVDFRVGNFGILNVTGIDAGLNINHATGFGSIDFGLNVNLPLTRKQQASPTSAVANGLATENPTLFLKSDLGLNIGAFRAQATWNHTNGYNITPTTSVPVQDHVAAYSTVDLFFKYDVPGDSMILKDLSLTLNVSNVFDKNPPVLLRNNPNELGFANGFTLGRLFQIGISKKF